MKNKGFSWILLIIWLTLLIPGVLAVDAKLKESYSPGETIIAEISGPFIEPITMTNIDFQRNGHVSVPLQAGLEKVNEKYYLWAIAPLIDNNYTFIIKNVKTLLNGAPNTTEYRKDFVVKGKIIDYNVNPGAIYTLNDFDVVITSNKNDPLDVSLNINDTGSVTIQPGKNTIHFSIDSVQKSKLNFIQIGMYQIPVYVKVNGSFQISRGLEFSPGLIGISFIDRKEAKVGVVNMGTERLNSIGIEYNSTLLSVVPDMIANLSSGETQYVTITLKQDVKNIKTDIYARAGTLSALLRIDASVNSSSPLETKKSGYYCSEIQGKVCMANQFCAGDTSNTLDGACCVGDCIEKKSTSTTSYAWIGWVLIIGIIIVAYFIWINYKKGKMEKNPLKKRVAEIEQKEKLKK